MSGTAEFKPNDVLVLYACGISINDLAQSYQVKWTVIRDFLQDHGVEIRSDVCSKGHSLDDAIIQPKTGRRNCRICRRIRDRKNRARKTQLAATTPGDQMTDTPTYSTNPLADMQAEVKAVNEANGWFDTRRSTLETQALMMTEVVEAIEAYRSWGNEDMTGLIHLDKSLTDPETGGTVFKPEGLGSEYADQFIRLLDACERDGVDLFFEYGRKLHFNKLRGYRHGGKRA